MKIRFLSLFCIFSILLSFSLPSFASENEIVNDLEKTKYTSGFTPEYEALSIEEKQKIRDAELKWYENHTFNVTIITTYQSESVDFKSVDPETVIISQNSTFSDNSEIIRLQVQETYYSEDLRFVKMFGSNSISDTSEYFIDSDISHITFEKTEVSLNQELSKTVSEQKTVVMTTESDPYIWSAYGYSHPTHLWKSVDGVYEEADPINLVWENATLTMVRQRILNAQSWDDWGYVAENNYTIWDAANQTHIISDSVATSIGRVTGGYHVRLYDFQGNVYGAAHQDSPVYSGLTYTGHQIVNFESVESLIAGCFMNNDWNVYSNSLPLLNGRYYAQNHGYPSVYNNGDATKITSR